MIGNRESKLRLRSIRFDKIKKASSAAALVLTSEISKWDGRVNHRLIPTVHHWDPLIYQQFSSLGYFEIFPSLKDKFNCEKSSGDNNILRYIKGTIGEHDKTRQLKKGIKELIGKKELDKWIFLHSGIGEAILNVTHHAYPEEQTRTHEKDWYLTASFNKRSRELKVSFYDQGVGIPATLPTSHAREYLKRYLRRLRLSDDFDSMMIRAALSYGRTRTNKGDRGKGLQDMLQFIKQRGNGYLSIISSHGLCKVTVESGVQTIKTVDFDQSLPGTLIIWSVTVP